MLLPDLTQPRRKPPRQHWTHLQKWDEIGDIIAGQMDVYMSEGKGLKACKLLRRIRMLTRRGVCAR